MKTNILNLAATLFAVASLSPVALAGQNFPVRKQTSGPVTGKADCCMTNSVCKDVPCCTDKTVASTAFGGRGSSSSFKKIRACESSCTVADGDKRDTCRKGSKA
jgi:hypothetical protein